MIQKNVIDNLIKKLEEIRDNAEEIEIEVKPYEEEDCIECVDGKVYCHLKQVIELKYKQLYQKGDKWDKVAYKKID